MADAQRASEVTKAFQNQTATKQSGSGTTEMLQCRQGDYVRIIERNIQNRAQLNGKTETGMGRHSDWRRPNSASGPVCFRIFTFLNLVPSLLQELDLIGRTCSQLVERVMDKAVAKTQLTIHETFAII
jgi:hypothetical protein